KTINCITNISALYVFISQGNYILEIAIIMAISNISGSIIGARMAILKGNQFIRKLFLFVVVIMIFRYGYDVFFS
ncbi:MAG: sulfite exporter TauE/SafE family protein, partial [Bacteroidetes bacterium]